MNLVLIAGKGIRIMKVILSRKGFDTANGGIPSPIMPDGTLLSMPIPSNDALAFDDLGHGEYTYREILRLLYPKGKYKNCHLRMCLSFQIWSH